MVGPAQYVGDGGFLILTIAETPAAPALPPRPPRAKGRGESKLPLWAAEHGESWKGCVHF